MENKDAPMDDKMEHQQSLKKVFGDHIEIVNCDKVFNDAGKVLFCEMLVKSDQPPVKKNCPLGFQIVAEVQE